MALLVHCELLFKLTLSISPQTVQYTIDNTSRLIKHITLQYKIQKYEKIKSVKVQITIKK